MSNTQEDNANGRRSYVDIPYAELGAVHPDGVIVGPTERYYKCSGQFTADLMTMGIGLKTSDFHEIGNVEEEPYRSMKLKKKVTATQKHMVEEIKRRCIVDGHLEQPKCGHWDKKKCLVWLQRNPLTNASDRAFVIAAEKKLYDLVTRVNKENLKEKNKGTAPLITAEPYIRLIECMLNDSIRPLFMEMHRMGERDDEAPLGDSRAKLIKIIAKWELSGNGFGQRGQDEDAFGHLGEDELQCGDNRANFMDSQTKEHILYLWHVADEQEILKNVLSVISDSCAASSEACSSVAGSVVTTARKRRVDERALGFFRAKMGLAMHTMSRAAIFKELRETQDKLFESQVKVMETTSSNISDLYMGRIRMLEAQVKAVQECLDSLDGEEAVKKQRRERRANKKRKTTASAAAAALDSDDTDSDDDDEEGLAAESGSMGY
ncbi:unknown protein [Seminavis robusta]|uniref:Uncharacterized protein n=1 Tax=Seminavis robusta TaxID=568900 RepID=A0A9N8EKS9_9STRA|nr:unknown protein [Seminavis robusta]|eukprot:Sro1091_g240290.1 n/a (434) ;mRNA; f:22648-24131